MDKAYRNFCFTAINCCPAAPFNRQSKANFAARIFQPLSGRPVAETDPAFNEN
jgi:hypothetical protein